jgi:hypothetical protein
LEAAKIVAPKPNNNSQKSKAKPVPPVVVAVVVLGKLKLNDMSLISYASSASLIKSAPFSFAVAKLKKIRRGKEGPNGN